MGHAPRKLADHFHLLRLAQLLFRSFALADFRHDDSMRPPQFAGSLGALFLKYLVQLSLLLLGFDTRGDVGRNAYQLRFLSISISIKLRVEFGPMNRAIVPDGPVF